MLLLSLLILYYLYITRDAEPNFFLFDRAKKRNIPVENLNFTIVNERIDTIQAMLNHSDTKVTMRYIGLEKDALDRYVDDMGRFYEDYVLGDKEYKEAEDEVIVHLELKDLRNLIHEVYYAGISNAAASDPKIHTETVLQAMSAIDQLKK